MQKLIQGIHQFREENFRPLQGLFEQLSKGQNPETLFITCSDSRIDPNLLTRSQPGDLFILRNAGNIVPPHGAANGGEAITLNRFWGDSSNEQVMGCGGGFALTGADMSAQWGGSKDSTAASLGIEFSQQNVLKEWEGCCYVCGANLELAGKLSSGWYCEKDWWPHTGIWLKGKNN